MKTHSYNKRIPVRTPNSIINKDGNPNYGTFKSPFKVFNFLDIRKPLFTQKMKQRRLTEWEALEVFSNDLLYLGVIYKVGKIQFSMHLFYDAVNNEIISLGNNKRKYQSIIAKNILNNNQTSRLSDTETFTISNQFDIGKCSFEGEVHEEGCDVKLNCDLTELSQPSVVVIPQKKYNPVYTQKSFMRINGNISINDKKHEYKDNLAIVDDHRGFYPRKSGYDWITTAFKMDNKGNKSNFALNLTYFYKNINQEVYNENGYWLDDKYHSLPVVRFYRDKDEWVIKDANNIVDLKFVPKNEHRIYKNFIIAKIDYLMAFGYISGTIKLSKTKEITINQRLAFGEKRYTKL